MKGREKRSENPEARTKQFWTGTAGGNRYSGNQRSSMSPALTLVQLTDRQKHTFYHSAQKKFMKIENAKIWDNVSIYRNAISERMEETFSEISKVYD